MKSFLLLVVLILFTSCSNTSNNDYTQWSSWENENQELIEFKRNIERYTDEEISRLKNHISNFNDEEKLSFFKDVDVSFIHDDKYYRSQWGWLWSKYDNFDENEEILLTFIDCLIPRYNWKEPNIKSDKKQKLYEYIKAYELWDREYLVSEFERPDNTDFKQLLGVIIDVHDTVCDITDKSCEYSDVTVLRDFIYGSMISNWYPSDKLEYEKQIDLYILCLSFKYSESIETVLTFVNQSSYFLMYNSNNQKVQESKRKEVVENFFSSLNIRLGKIN